MHLAHRLRRTWRRLVIRTMALAAAVLLVSGVATGPAYASTHALIDGSGSTWAENAVNQWIADVQQNGLQVVFTGVGSAQGRKDFANATTDYAVSDIGYQGSDPVTGASDASTRPYAYVPIVAGGTAFPYHIEVGGQLLRNLRLSGDTLAKIFTNQITNWNDPAVTRDNNGHALPSIPIIPVVHSEGAGSTAQFTTYLSKVHPSTWRSFAGYSSFTEYYPRQGGQIAQNGSDGVMNFVTSGAANGAIGYDEYSYAKAKDYPVAKVQNSAGYFTAPTQYNVAVALTQAHINTDPSSPNYLLQDLSDVYTYGDPRTYPLSSYSYGIIPTSADDPRMTTAKRQTLADYLYYSTCQGQAEIGPIGYSPLPINLVEASFAQVAKLGQADSHVNLTQENVQNCHNPTFVAGQPQRNYLAEIAPQPPSCDRVGAGPCGALAGLANSNPVNGKAPVSAASPAASGGGGPSGPTGGPVGGANASASVAPGAAGGAPAGVPATTSGRRVSSIAGKTTIDPLTGQQVTSGMSASPDSGQAPYASPTMLAADTSTGLHGLLAGLAVALLLALLALPPITRWALTQRTERK